MSLGMDFIVEFDVCFTNRALALWLELFGHLLCSPYIYP